MTFMYWWMNTCQRIKALGAKKWFLKDNPKASGYSAEHIKNMSVSMTLRIIDTTMFQHAMEGEERGVRFPQVQESKSQNPTL